MKYNPNKIERKWQRYWATKKIYNAKDKVVGKKNFMMLAEFPYTSGNLHIGHWFTYSIADIFARYLRMNGHNVMNPIGFDAFGLPAENAAIKNNTTPALWTRKNINYMSKQLKSIGATFDWSRIADTSKPDYYRWTQWIFLKLYEKGLAYRAATKVNWCPKDKTVLANEQVVNGLCERCDTAVIQKELTQWMFKITDYADALIDDIKDLDWPEDTKLAQKNWVGRSEGLIFKSSVKDTSLEIQTFSTHFEAFFADTFIVIAPDHPMLKKLIVGTEKEQEVLAFADSLVRKRLKEGYDAEKEPEGIFTGRYTIDPVGNGELPIWVANYAIADYGTGIVKASCHDERDFKFAKKYKISLKPVLFPLNPTESEKVKNLEVCFTDMKNGILSEPAEFNGKVAGDYRNKIADFAVKKGLAVKTIKYRLRDWILSRQRYWGAPIPMINCPACGYQPVVEEDLPVKLPPLKNFKPADDGRSPLAKAKEWLKVKCPKCGGEAERETDTMDTFVDSSWYFMRYTDPNNKKEFASRTKMNEWLPVSMYIGGREHNTMHLLYARFITKALNSLGLVDFKEPFISRRNHGVIMGPDGKRMSKSRGNVVDPDVEVKKYGTDAVRINFAFMGPFDQDYAWNNSSINGIIRFLNRVWNYVGRYDPNIRPNPGAQRILNKSTKEIQEDIKGMSFNTGVSSLMKLLNELESHEISKDEYETLLKLLAPFAPHLAEELWFSVLKNKKSIHLEKWPEYDEKLLSEEKIKLVIQVNGRVRDTIEVEKGLSEEEAKKLALSSENVKKHITGEIKKVVYVKDRIINLVV